MVFPLICGSNENDITMKLKKIIEENAGLRQEVEESKGSSKSLV